MPRLPKNMKCEIRVFNGLPLNVEFCVCPAEPDVGINNTYIDDVVLYDRQHKHAKWAENKMTEDDWEDVQLQCWDFYKSCPHRRFPQSYLDTSPLHDPIYVSPQRGHGQ